MRSQESLNELRYLRRIQEEVEDQWRSPRPDLDRLHRIMGLLYTSHGLVWKSHGCSGSGEHDPFAREIVELALRIERSTQYGAHRAFNIFEQWRCEACGWNCNALYTQWASYARDGDQFHPLDAIDAHQVVHQLKTQGVGQPLPEATELRDHTARIRLEANVRIAERLREWAAAGLLSEDVEVRYRSELSIGVVPV